MSGLGLGGMTVLRYTRVFTSTDGMIFNTVKNTDAFLSISVAPHNKTERRKLIDRNAGRVNRKRNLK